MSSASAAFSTQVSNLVVKSTTFESRLTDRDRVVAAVERGPRDSQGNKLFTNEELDWFARYSYNLGLKYMGSWELRCCIQILTA